MVSGFSGKDKNFFKESGEIGFSFFFISPKIFFLFYFKFRIIRNITYDIGGSLYNYCWKVFEVSN